MRPRVILATTCIAIASYQACAQEPRIHATIEEMPPGALAELMPKVELIGDDAETSSTAAASMEFEELECYQTLLESRHFAHGIVGYGGMRPTEVDALNSLLERADADSVLKALYGGRKRATTKLYALCGLYFTDQSAFKAGVEELRRSGVSVDVMSGCIVMKQPVADLVWTETNVLVIDDPARATEVFAKSSGANLDIAHGGIPAAIRSMKVEKATPCTAASPSSSSPPR